MTVSTQDPEPNTELVKSGAELADENAVRSLLARANLLRMRRQWDESIAACTEVLRYDPRSSSAHSLLGDIYEAQGKGEDAIQWYAMALEIDPANASDRAKLDHITETQRVRLRTQDIAAAAAAPPAAKRERTLEWFDRIFPPGRTDSVARLILALSLGFAAIIVLCTGFIYFFIVPRRDVSLADNGTASSVERAAPEIPVMSQPVLMTPSSAEPKVEKTESAGLPSLGASVAHAELAVSSLSGASTGETAAHVAAKPAGVVSVATTSDPAALKTRIAPLVNSSEMQVAGVTSGPNGSLYLDLVLTAASAPETTDRLRERALRAASVGAHAFSGLVSPEMDHVFVRIAVALPTIAARTATSASHAARTMGMVFAAQVPLRYFRDADVANLTASDLAGRFQSAQWYSAVPDARGAAATSTEMASAGTPPASSASGLPAPGSTSTTLPTQ